MTAIFLIISLIIIFQKILKMSQDFDEVTAGSPVAQFYENRVIFITGSTGFMGKVRKIGYFL